MTVIATLELDDLVATSKAARQTNGAHGGLGTGGVQGFLGITPDLTCLGKVIGGGMPVGAFGGRRDIMEQISPLGPVYQAGTLSGNPVAMAAGLATMSIISEPGFYDDLFRRTGELCTGMREAAAAAGVPFTTNHLGSMFGGFFTEDETVTQYHQVINSNVEAFKIALDRGDAVHVAGDGFGNHAGHLIAQLVHGSFQCLEVIKGQGDGVLCQHVWHAR